MRSAGNGSLALALLVWMGLCLIGGLPLFPCIFLIVAVFWALPRVWYSGLSRTFENHTDRMLLFAAAILVVLALFSIL